MKALVCKNTGHINNIGEGVSSADDTCDLVDVTGTNYKEGGTLIDGEYTAPVDANAGIVAAFKALDPSTETGTLKTIIEYLQR